MQYWRNPQGIVRGVTHKGDTFILEVRPRIENLEGRFSQNGIRVPKTGRWIVLANGLIEENHVVEIAKTKSVMPTLYISTRQDGAIIQDR